MPVQTQLHHPLQEHFKSYTKDAAYRPFLKQCCSRPDVHYAIFTLPFICNDPLTYLKALHNNADFLYYWEQPAQNLAITAGGVLAELCANGPGRFGDMQRAINSIKKKTLHFNPVNDDGFRFLGGFSFFDELCPGPWQPFGAASFVLPQKAIIKHGNETSLSLAFQVEAQCTPQKLHATLRRALGSLRKNHTSTRAKSSFFTADNPPKEENSASPDEYGSWIKMIKEAKEWITQKNIEKVVLARELRVNSQQEHQPAAILDRLRTQYPKCCSFLIQKNHSEAFIGCSPERLLSFQGNTIRTEALAGSIARGDNEDEDQALATQLLNSAKNNQEHFYVVKAIEESISPLVENMEREEHPSIKKLANVQHLHTPVLAEMNKDINPLNLLAALHPTPAVGGYPRDLALQYIRQHEHFNRGWFAGPVGWIDSKGSGEFTVAIRSGLIGKYTARLFAGCGIVAGSDPETEWQETNLKLMPMLAALRYD